MSDLLREVLEQAFAPAEYTVDPKWRAAVEARAKDMAERIGRCPKCQSTNLESGAAEGLSKLKPWVSCGDCGCLIAWG